MPVLLAPHETADLAEASVGTDWEDVVDVLAALREQDARLDEIIRVQQVAKGRGEVFNPRAGDVARHAAPDEEEGQIVS